MYKSQKTEIESSADFNRRLRREQAAEAEKAAEAQKAAQVAASRSVFKTLDVLHSTPEFREYWLHRNRDPNEQVEIVAFGQGLESIGSATTFADYVNNEYRPLMLPLMARTTQNRYEGVIKNYLLSFGALEESCKLAARTGSDDAVALALSSASNSSDFHAFPGYQASILPSGPIIVVLNECVMRSPSAS